MKKRLFALLLCLCAVPPFGFFAAAAERDAPFASLYAEAFAAVDDETRSLLESVGVTGADVAGLLGLSPDGVFALVRELFGAAVNEKLGLFGACLAVMLLIKLFSAFLPSPPLSQAAGQFGALFTQFLLMAGCAAAADACVRAVTLTKTFMLALVPVLGAAVSFAGSPVTALRVTGPVFAFAEGVSVLFADLLLPVAGVGAAMGCAAALCPVAGLEKLAAMLNRLAVWGMGLASGVFSGVLTLSGAVAGAADSVSLRGLRFVIGGAVPVVGGALSEGLSSLTASLGLIKNGAAALGLAAAVFMNLPAVCSLLVWKLLLSFLSLSADVCEVQKIPAFLTVMRAVFNVLLAAVLFNLFTFTVALGILLGVKTA